MRRALKQLAVTIALSGIPFCVSARAQTEAAASTTLAANSARQVALSPGTCVSVSNGDTITLDWSPSFEHAGSTNGMRHFEMTFARREEMDRIARIGAPLLLVANPRMHGELPGHPDSEIEEAGNGSFHIRFHPDLGAIAPGEYYLVNAQAFARISQSGQDAEAQMTNSPTRYPFCLTVVPPQDGRRRR